MMTPDTDIEKTVLCATDGPIATITLNRPAKLNAIDPTMLMQLDAIAADLERAHDVRVYLIKNLGAGYTEATE